MQAGCGLSFIRDTSSDTLERYARVQVVDRTFLPTFLFGPNDVVVALGRCVANTLKYLSTDSRSSA